MDTHCCDTLPQCVYSVAGDLKDKMQHCIVNLAQPTCFDALTTQVTNPSLWSRSLRFIFSASDHMVHQLLSTRIPGTRSKCISKKNAFSRNSNSCCIIVFAGVVAVQCTVLKLIYEEPLCDRCPLRADMLKTEACAGRFFLHMAVEVCQVETDREVN